MGSNVDGPRIDTDVASSTHCAAARGILRAGCSLVSRSICCPSHDVKKNSLRCMTISTALLLSVKTLERDSTSTNIPSLQK